MLRQIKISVFIKRLFFLLALIGSFYTASSQPCQEEYIDIDPTDKIPVIELLQAFTGEHGILFSYSPSIVNVQENLKFENSRVSWEEVLDAMIIDKYLDYECDNTGKIIIYRSTNIRLKSNTNIRHYGTIFDEKSKEKLIGATLLLMDSSPIGVSDENGFYSIVGDLDSFMVKYLGYQTSTIIIGPNGTHKDIGLISNNELATVTISSTKVDEITDIEGENGNINFENNRNTLGILGDDNGLNLIKQKPGVQVGSEGETGLIVRGGTSDQNLYLYNGVPMYELSHAAGLSSILQSDNIHNIELFKNGIPAKYGGRLSSVVNIKTKNGHKNRIEGNFGLSLSSLSFHLEGPIVNDKLSFNINASQSTVGIFANSLIKKLINYDDFNLNYNDFSANFHYQISKNDELKIFGYSGKDDVLLESKIDSINGQNNFSFTDRIAIQWGTKLYGAEYQRIISRSVVLKVALSKSEYKISNRGSYTSIRNLNGSSSSNELDILSSSTIKDGNMNLYLDVYPFKYDKLSVGVSYINHQFEPAVVQSTLISAGGVDEAIGEPNMFNNKEVGLFAEYKNHVLKYFKINAGVRNTSFKNDEKTYTFWEPRISILSNLSSHLNARISYNKLSQGVHLLTNPGAGIPADLWVPNTSKIRPEQSSQYAVSLEWKNKFVEYFAMSIFDKKYQNLLEYQGSEDVFFTVVNRDNPSIVFDNNSDWESRIISGDGSTTGWEIAFRQKIGSVKAMVAYTRSSSTKTFKEIDNGNPFPHKNDRPHDIKFNLNYKMSEHWQLDVNFSYGSGGTYTLALEEFVNANGDTINVSNGRNNNRLPAFHHLDTYLQYQKKYNNKSLNIQFGIYNIYNRLNPFYVFLYEGAEKKDLRLRQVSLFPILPTIKIKYNFLNEKE